jgi:hypothetical protein
MLSPRAVLFAVPFLGAALAAQTTWVVSGGGQALQNTIALAAPGDVLDVQAGTYDAVVCSKGLRIALCPGAVVDGTTAAVTITNLPAAERFQLDGGLVRGIAASTNAGTIVVDGVHVQLFQVWSLLDCSGPIVFDQVDYTLLAGSTSGHLQLVNCPDVTFRDCKLPQLTCQGSRMVLQDSEVRPWGFSAPGINLVSGNAAIQGGYVTGSAAVFFSLPQPAIRVISGKLQLTGGANVVALQYFSQTAAGVVNGGTLQLDPGVAITGTPPVLGATPQQVHLPSLSVTLAATSLNATTHGRAGDLLVTFAGLGTPPYATPWGDAWLLPTDPILDVTLLPANGSGTFSHTFAAVPPFVLLTLQSVALDPTGGLQLGVPTRFAWN